MSSFSLIYSNRVAFAVISIIISALVVGTSIIKVYYLNIQQSSSSIPNVIVFIILSAICMIGQYYVLGYANKKSKEVGDYKKLHIKVLRKAVACAIYGLTAINVFVIVQMVAIKNHFGIAFS
jgi:Na+/H+-translocating membrane pyrophosphatase